MQEVAYSLVKYINIRICEYIFNCKAEGRYVWSMYCYNI